ncbi:MAG: hypothetical protein QM669_06885, partial [Siphonobacter sp.]
MKKAFRLFFQSLLYCILIVLIMAASVMVVLQIPVVQTKATAYLTDWFYEQTHYPVSIGRVDYRFPDQLVLEHVSVPDTLKQPMIDIDILEVNFPLIHMIGLDYPIVKVDWKTSSVFGWLDINVPELKLVEKPVDDIHLNHVRLYKPDVRLVVQKDGDLNIDYFINAIDRLTAPKTPRKHPGKSIPFTIGEAVVEDGVFHYDDPRKKPFNEKGTFDYNHFKISELQGHVTDFLVFSDTIAANIDHLRGIDKVAQLRVHQLDTRFFFSEKRMSFYDLFVRVNQSTLRRFVEFRYNDTPDLGDFNEKVRIIADLDSSIVYPHDLARFASDLYSFKDRWTASGHFDGTVRKFVFNARSLHFGQRSYATGTFGFRGLPDFETSDMDFNLRKFITNAQDLAQYTGPRTTKVLTNFGTIDYSGIFAGRYNDFQAKGRFQTALGVIIPDLSMKIADVIENSTYKGKLQLIDFALGKLTDRPELLQNLDLDGQVEGTGFDPETAVVKLNTTAQKFGFQGYTYRNIDIDGNLQLGLFDGRIVMRDTNLVFDLKGQADLRQKRNFFDIEGKIDRAMLHPLGISEENIRLQSELHVVWTGLDIDQMYGAARLRDTYLTRMLASGDRNLLIDTLYLVAPKPVDKRYISLESDILNATIEGPFQISKAIEDIPSLVKEYKIYFTEPDSVRQQYYVTKAVNPVHYNLAYSVLFKDAQPLMAFLYPEGYLSPNSKVQGEFSMGNTLVFNIDAKSDTLLIDKYHFYGSEIDINTSKFANRNEVLASAVITSSTQQIKSVAPTENLQVEASWEKDHIAFTSRLRQQESTNRLNLNGDIYFKPEGTDLHFRRSRIRILDQDWNLNPGNQIRLAGNTIDVKDLTFQNIEQSISLNGTVSEDPQQSLLLEAHNFNLATLQPILQVNVKGTLNSSVTLRDAYEGASSGGNINVD